MSINSYFLQHTRERWKGEALSPCFPWRSTKLLGRTFVVLNPIAPKHEHYIAAATAGTSGNPVAEEAAVTAETFRKSCERNMMSELRVAHRLFNRLEDIQGASVVIVIAGMEGALVSVVGGLADVPVIAAPLRRWQARSNQYRYLNESSRRDHSS